jgi:glycosyltransferase involved in cell wall biosynthesis
VDRGLAFHARFSALATPIREPQPEVAVVSCRIDLVPWDPQPLRVLSILARDASGYLPLVGIDVRDDAFFVPTAYENVLGFVTNVLAVLAPRLGAISEAVPELRFGTDALLDAIDSGFVAIPGRSPYATLIDAVDRARAVAPLAAGRSVGVVVGGVGYGTHILGAVATSVCVLPLDAEIAAAFGVSSAPPSAFPTACGVALGVRAESTEAVIASLRAVVASDGVIVVTNRGIDAEAHFSRMNLASRPLPRLGADALAPLADERIAVLAPVVVPIVPVAVAQPATVDPRPLRVLFVFRALAAGSAATGDKVQVQRTAEALRARGHRVDVSADPHPEVPSEIDVVHLTNLTVPAETLEQARAVERTSSAVVLMPIFTDHADETAWGIQVWPKVFTTARSREELDVYLRALAERRLNAVYPHHGGGIAPPARIDLVPGYTDMQRAIVARTDYLVTNAHSEAHRIYRYLEPGVPYSVAPSAVDPTIYAPETAATFRDRYALGDFVLSMGRIEGRKNQILLAYALRGSGRRLVLVGRNVDVQQAYLAQAFLGPDVVLFGEMPEADLASLVAAARVVALPSWDEVVSLSSLNAAASGASLVLTRNSYEHEYFGDDAEYCDPADVRSIAASVERAWNAHDIRAERRSLLAARVRSEYTWEAAAAATEAAYHRVLAFNPRGEARRRRAMGA